MFRIKIADLVIEIENKYGYIRSHCRKYRVWFKKPDFRVSVTEEEILLEQNGNKHFPFLCYGYDNIFSVTN